MHVLQQLAHIDAPGCIKVYCEKTVPDRLITLHRSTIKTENYLVINLPECDIDDLFAQLSITFLGQVQVYALKDGDLSPSNRKKVDLFLKQYTGPHTVYFFSSEPQYQKDALVIDRVVTLSTFHELAQLSQKRAVAPAFITKLFTHKKQYTFDQALLLLEYADLLGSRNEIFLMPGSIELLLTKCHSLHSANTFSHNKNHSYLLNGNA